MDVIGLGKIGSAIVEKLSKHEQYSVFKISSDKQKSNNNFFIEDKTSPEQYDENPINPNFDIGSELDFILCGEETISASSLRILENYKDRKIRIFYIRPNHKFLSDVQKLTDNSVFNILQEYTRSKRFDSMYILDQDSISKIMGKVPITVFYDKLYEYISSTIHMINFLDNSEPIMSSLKESPPTYCLNTIGVMDLKSGIESWFYPLDQVRETRYYYCINKEQLNTDGDLLDLINEQINSKIQENVSMMLGIFPSGYQQNYCYIVSKSPHIQK